jgi:hypothetical protein
MSIKQTMTDEDLELNLYEQEKMLKNALKQTKYQRFGNAFYSKRGQLIKECGLREFAWNYCSQPQYANKMTKWLKKNVVDSKKVLRLFSSGNQKLHKKDLIDDWNLALEEAYKLKRKPNYVYTCDVGSFDDKNSEFKIACEDGDLFNGLIFEKTMWKEVTGLSIGLRYRFKDCDEDNEEDNFGNIEYDYNQNDLEKILSDVEFDEHVLVVPFKHPIPLVNLKGEMYITVYTNSDSFEFDDVRPVLTLANSLYRKWIEENSFMFSFDEREKFSYSDGWIEEL